MQAVTPTGTIMRTTLTDTMAIRTETDVGPAQAGASLLQLMWLASPALPVGGFSYSEGLEAAVDAALVHDEATAAQWLLHQLELTLARSELPVLAQAITAWRAADRNTLGELNQWLLQTRETHEFRLQTVQMGRSMLEWLKNHQGMPRADLQTCAALQACYPIAFALGVAHSGAQVHDGLLSFAFGWAENMVQAAIKAVPLGQSAGQRILAQLAQRIPSAAGRALRTPAGEQQAFAPMLAILSARHETQYSRLFRS
jgi:urease accessory protein